MDRSDARRFPDFTLLTPEARYTEVVDVVIISHLYVHRRRGGAAK